MQPFLKWAGGKRWLIPKIIESVPKFATYYEPFLGSGALFFALEPRRAVLSDTNPELINCFRGVRDHCASIIKILKGMPINQTAYYKVRDHLYPRANPIRRAAYFIYLNRTCWNGLYRVNRAGRFNVPRGKMTRKGPLVDSEDLIGAQILLKRAVLKCDDFEVTSKEAGHGDMVYFDPPYITTHLKNGFIKYNSKLFHPSDEMRLAAQARTLAGRGVSVAVSNAAHPLIKQQFDGPFHKYEFDRASLIAGDPGRRKKFRELLVTTFDVTQ